MRQPHVAKEPVIPLLVQDELAVPSEARIHLAMAVEVRSVVPAAVVVVKKQDHAFADVDEDADVFAAPDVVVRQCIRTWKESGGPYFWRCWLHPPSLLFSMQHTA